MLRTILVGLDGSPHAEAAVSLAVSWAKAGSATVVGVAVVDEETIREPRAVPLGGMTFKHDRDEALLADAKRRVRGFLDDFAGRCKTAGVNHAEIEDVGLPWKAIVQESERFDLVVLGKQTQFHFETSRSKCETLREVIRHSPRPVVAVPPTTRTGSATLIAYDGSVQSARAIAGFVHFTPPVGQEIYVLAVGADKSEAAARAGRACEFLGHHGRPATPRPMVSADLPAEVILAQAEALNAGLIVAGAFSHSQLSEFFFGSATQTLLERCSVPLFVSH